MAYQTLYRKYRPSSFDYIYGQEVIIKTLKNIILNNKVSHAYLFTGPRGTGKTSTAKLFAKAINCTNNTNGNPCNKCSSCNSYNNNSNPDIIEIDAASNNGVDEIREIRSNVNLLPSMSNYKVYIIDEVHMLSLGAFNALLKTLEEPPQHVIFILATTDPQKVPITVISRCQRFDFKNINSAEMRKCLNNIIKEEKINISDDAVEEIIINSTGGMRDAIGLLDQASSFCIKKIESSDIQELTGTISDAEAIKFIGLINDKNIIELLNIIDKYSNSGKDVGAIIEKCILILQKKLINDKIFHKEEEKINNPYELIEFLINLNEKLKNTTQIKILLEINLMKFLDNPIINNVPRGTLIENNIQQEKTIDVPYERMQNEDNLNTDVPRGTLKEISKYNTLKSIRINNILFGATKKDLEIINNRWNNINEYILDNIYNSCSRILLNSKPVAASKKGIIITVPTITILQKIELNYDLSKELINKISKNNYKIVYILEEYWKKIRPEYAKKAQNKELKEQNEEEELNKIKELNKNLIKGFDELIEMEEK